MLPLRLLLRSIFRTCLPRFFLFFFFNDTATTEIYTLSLHDALPISGPSSRKPTVSPHSSRPSSCRTCCAAPTTRATRCSRSEEHTSELQSRLHLVCRLLLEKKKKGRPTRPNARGTRLATVRMQARRV